MKFFLDKAEYPYISFEKSTDDQKVADLQHEVLVPIAEEEPTAKKSSKVIKLNFWNYE